MISGLSDVCCLHSVGISHHGFFKYICAELHAFYLNLVDLTLDHDLLPSLEDTANRAQMRSIK